MLPSQYIEKGWIQHDYCLDIRNNPVGSKSSIATKWCLIAALNRSYFEKYITKEQQYNYYELLKSKTQTRPDLWNDMPVRAKQQVISIMKIIEEELNLI